MPRCSPSRFAQPRWRRRCAEQWCPPAEPGACRRVDRRMVQAFVGSLFLVAAAGASAQPTPASLSTTPVAAQSLFERDWVLMNWALKLYDADRDIMLQPAEAE